MSALTVRILGTHGVPANYGGFETAAERVARHLVERDWRVVVYCQASGSGQITEDRWQGIERVTIPIPFDGWRGTALFDSKSIQHACHHRDICLTFGYNTAIFNLAQKVLGIPNVINMDGIEWSRARWGPVKQAILWGNERIGCLVGEALVADHPEIARHLSRLASAHKINMITYGADSVTREPPSVPTSFGLSPGRYCTLIARPIPEDSILELVAGFSLRPRGLGLAVLGDYDSEHHGYHREVMAAASDEVKFLGPLYRPEVVRALRLHSMAYLHGHTVGGTNPSLVEALGAGNAVLAHDNPYNRWVAKDAAVYFKTVDDVSDQVEFLSHSLVEVERMRSRARARHAKEFTWQHVASQYESLLKDLVESRQHRPSLRSRWRSITRCATSNGREAAR